MNIKAGDRIRGLATHQGKTGIVIEVPNSLWVVVKWDNGKRKSVVGVGMVQVIHE